ncbi:MAG: Fe-S cluster assembly protein SufD [Bacteroidetes bacterium 4572_117]|nr:MAG: Fe-S cluster assembly protein SufD [Bacteroidetes bacterium 4572_117]
MALKIRTSKKDFLKIFEKDGTEVLSKGLVKEKALKRLEQFKLPDKTDEAWRHTSLNRLLQHNYSQAENRGLSDFIVNSFSIPGLDAYRLVFINGFFAPTFSDIKNDDNGLIIKAMVSAKIENKDLFEQYFGQSEIRASNFFTSLNTVYSTNGSFIYFADNFVADKPIHIVNLSDGKDRKTVSQYRNLIIASKNSQAKIINSYHSLSVNYTLTNIATEIFLEDGAHLSYNIFQGEGVDSTQFNNVKVIQQSNSFFSSSTTTLCGMLVRNDLNVEHKGTNCETDLNGLYLPDREQHFDNTVFVHHAKPHNTSNQLYKGIIDNKASAVFQGKVLVDKDAQKTLANQSNKNILLTKYAKINSKPQLEIYADDVACSHGSTTGQIDKEALFYIQSRGINRRRAETLLLSAFVKDVIDKIEIDSYKFYIQILVNNRLKGEKVDGQCIMIDECPACD